MELWAEALVGEYMRVLEVESYFLPEQNNTSQKEISRILINDPFYIFFNYSKTFQDIVVTFIAILTTKIPICHLETKQTRAREMVPPAKVFAVKSSDLSSILGTDMVEGENRFQQDVL